MYRDRHYAKFYSKNLFHIFEPFLLEKIICLWVTSYISVQPQFSKNTIFYFLTTYFIPTSITLRSTKTKKQMRTGGVQASIRSHNYLKTSPGESHSSTIT